MNFSTPIYKRENFNFYEETYADDALKPLKIKERNNIFIVHMHELDDEKNNLTNEQSIQTFQSQMSGLSSSRTQTIEMPVVPNTNSPVVIDASTDLSYVVSPDLIAPISQNPLPVYNPPNEQVLAEGNRFLSEFASLDQVGTNLFSSVETSRINALRARAYPQRTYTNVRSAIEEAPLITTQISSEEYKLNVDNLNARDLPMPSYEQLHAQHEVSVNFRNAVHNNLDPQTVSANTENLDDNEREVIEIQTAELQSVVAAVVEHAQNLIGVDNVIEQHTAMLEEMTEQDRTDHNRRSNTINSIRREIWFYQMLNNTIWAMMAWLTPTGVLYVAAGAIFSGGLGTVVYRSISRNDEPAVVRWINNMAAWVRYNRSSHVSSVSQLTSSVSSLGQEITNTAHAIRASRTSTTIIVTTPPQGVSEPPRSAGSYFSHFH